MINKELAAALGKGHRALVTTSLQLCPDQHPAGPDGPTGSDAERLLADPGVIELVDAMLLRWAERRREELRPRPEYDPRGPANKSILAGAGVEDYLDRMIKRERPERRERFEAAVVRAAKALCQLRYLCRALAAAPVMVPSGQERPRTRVRYVTHPQRSYQDVQNELAVELASLPRFTTLCNMEGEQHRVRLAAPVNARIDAARIERVRRASKQRFGRGGEPSPAAEGGPAGPGPAPSQIGDAGRARPIGRRSAPGSPQDG